MMVAGDPATQTNQIHLLDISDLPESEIPHAAGRKPPLTGS